MGQRVGRGQVNVQGIHKTCLGDFFQRAITLPGSSRVVHQDVEAAPVVGQAFHHLCQCRLVCDVAGEG